LCLASLNSSRAKRALSLCKRASPSCTLRPPAALPHPAFPVAEARYADLGLQMVEVDGSRCLLRSKPGLGDSGEACGNWFEACEGDGPSCMLASPRLFRFSYRPAPYLQTAAGDDWRMTTGECAGAGGDTCSCAPRLCATFSLFLSCLCSRTCTFFAASSRAPPTSAAASRADRD